MVKGRQFVSLVHGWEFPRLSRTHKFISIPLRPLDWRSCTSHSSLIDSPLPHSVCRSSQMKTNGCTPPPPLRGITCYLTMQKWMLPDAKVIGPLAALHCSLFYNWCLDTCFKFGKVPHQKLTFFPLKFSSMAARWALAQIEISSVYYSPLCGQRHWWHFIIHITILEFQGRTELHPVDSCGVNKCLKYSAVQFVSKQRH